MNQSSENNEKVDHGVIGKQKDSNAGMPLQKHEYPFLSVSDSDLSSFSEKTFNEIENPKEARGTIRKSLSAKQTGELIKKLAEEKNGLLFHFLGTEEAIYQRELSELTSETLLPYVKSVLRSENKTPYFRICQQLTSLLMWLEKQKEILPEKQKEIYSTILDFLSQKTDFLMENLENPLIQYLRKKDQEENSLCHQILIEKQELLKKTLEDYLLEFIEPTSLMLTDIQTEYNTLLEKMDFFYKINPSLAPHPQSEQMISLIRDFLKAIKFDFEKLNLKNLGSFIQFLCDISDDSIKATIIRAAFAEIFRNLKNQESKIRLLKYIKNTDTLMQENFLWLALQDQDLQTINLLLTDLKKGDKTEFDETLYDISESAVKTENTALLEHWFDEIRQSYEPNALAKLLEVAADEKKHQSIKFFLSKIQDLTKENTFKVSKLLLESIEKGLAAIAETENLTIFKQYFEIYNTLPNKKTNFINHVLFIAAANKQAEIVEYLRSNLDFKNFHDMIYQKLSSAARFGKILSLRQSFIVFEYLFSVSSDYTFSISALIPNILKIAASAGQLEIVQELLLKATELKIEKNSLGLENILKEIIKNDGIIKTKLQPENKDQKTSLGQFQLIDNEVSKKGILDKILETYNLLNTDGQSENKHQKTIVEIFNFFCTHQTSSDQVHKLLSDLENLNYLCSIEPQVMPKTTIFQDYLTSLLALNEEQRKEHNGAIATLFSIKGHNKPDIGQYLAFSNIPNTGLEEVVNAKKYISDLASYGKKLEPQSIDRDIALDTANALEEIADRWFFLLLKNQIHPAGMHQSEKEEIKTIAQTFQSTLDKGYNEMANQRSKWKPALKILGNIALALTGVGIIPLGIKFALTRDFFFTPKTKRQEIIADIKQSVSSIPTAPVA